MIALTEILQYTSWSTVISEYDIKSKSKYNKVAKARFLFCYFALKYSTKNKRDICKFINRWHSSFSYYNQMHDKYMSIDSNYRDMHDTIAYIIDND